MVSRPGVAGQPLDDQLTALIAALGGTEVAGSRVAPFDGKADTWPFDEDHVAVFFVNVEVNERSRRSRESRA